MEVSAVRVIALAIAIVLLVSAPALAAVPVNAAMVKAAQNYGRSQADMAMDVFLQPWTVYEEKAARLDETAERACVYTPFLLIAADARDRAAAGGAVAAADADRVLGDYDGYVIIGVTLTVAQAAVFGDKYTASLRQDRKQIRPGLVNAPQAPAGGGASPVQVQVFFYFPSAAVSLDRSAALTVSAADGRQRIFRVPFGEFR